MNKTKERKSKKKINKNTSTSKLKLLEKKINNIDIELNKHKEKNIRLLAEFDNYKKRVTEKQNNFIKYDGENIIKSILPILDDLDRTMKLKELKNNKVVHSGIKMILDKLNKALDEYGIAAYQSVGKEFDPNLHEALMMKKSKKKTNCN